jgi:hypothetical protein
MSGSPTPVGAAPETASSILLLTPSTSGFDDTACIDFLTGAEPARSAVLAATVDESPAERVALWQRETGTEALPARTVIVDASGNRHAVDGPDVDDLSVEGLPSNAEPIDVGMALARHLGAWETCPGSTVLCLHSLTALLERFDRGAVVSLVSALNALCDSVDATAHHHLDPAPHDDALVATFRPLYDAVIEHLPEDGWTVRRAPDDAERPSFRPSTAPPGGTAGTDPSRRETIPMPYSFDQTLDLISVPRRRTLLYHLKDLGVGAVPIDDIVDAVVTRERSIPARDAPESVDSVRVSLVHTHIPKLADLGIVEYDLGASTVRYHGNPALESFLRYAETLELG